MVIAEQTEATETGLDVAIKVDDGTPEGRVVAWTYNMEIGRKIADAMSNFNRDGNGDIACQKCGKPCCYP